MRKLIPFLVLIVLSACTKMVDEPQNLLSKQQMAEIIADFAIYDQAFAVKPDTNMELASRFVLKKHHTNSKTYTESYKFYLSDPSDLQDILKKAQKIILDKDPKLEEYLEKKKKENPGVPFFVK